MRDIVLSICQNTDFRVTGGFSSESVRIAGTLVRMYGATNDDIQQVLKIDDHTFTSWLSIHPEFADEIQAARDEVNSQHVEASLLKRAIGYEAQEEEESTTPKGTTHTIKRVHIPGDVAAQKFFLNKRSSRRWPEKQEQGDAHQREFVQILNQISVSTQPLAHVHAQKTVNDGGRDKGTQASELSQGDTI
jgi:hypothetical protein